MQIAPRPGLVLQGVLMECPAEDRPLLLQYLERQAKIRQSQDELEAIQDYRRMTERKPFLRVVSTSEPKPG